MEGVEILELDVTSDESIRRCVKAVEKRTGGSLDVLVNNAGTDFVMPLLDTSVDEAKKLYDLNVWSILATTQAFTPMLLKAGGVLCNVSSISATMTFAWSGMLPLPRLSLPGAGLLVRQAYIIALKAAATMISETLRLELEPLGIRVIRRR